MDIGIPNVDSEESAKPIYRFKVPCAQRLTRFDQFLIAQRSSVVHFGNLGPNALRGANFAWSDSYLTFRDFSGIAKVVSLLAQKSERDCTPAHRWRQMLEFTPQLVRLFGPDHERIYADRTGLDYLGLSLEEWRQIRDMCRLVHLDDGDLMRAFFDRARPIGSAFELEMRLRKADGSYRWFLVRYNPVGDNKGQVTRWYVAGTDIEDRKQAGDRLQRENVAVREEIDKASMFEEIVGTPDRTPACFARA
jgi:PAS domain S-box-containing protein